MRVLHLTRDFPPRHTGGLSTAVAAYDAALRGAGVTTAVVSFDHWRRHESGAPLFAVRDRRDANQRDATPDGEAAMVRVRRGAPAAAIAAAARDFAPSLLHLHHENLWPFADLLRRALDCPVVYSVHILQGGPAAARGKERAASASSADQATALAAADLITAPSLHALRAAAQRAPAAKPLRLVPNIVAAADTAPRRTEPLATYAGRFDHAKGTDILFDVMQIALGAAAELRFEIAGGLPASRKRERRWLRRWRERENSSSADRAAFRGWLRRDELVALHARARVHLAPSRCETFGLSAAEAMAQGVPVVAAGGGALAELVSDGETGLLAGAEDSRALADAVLQLVRDPQRAARMGERAAAAVHRRFSAAAVLPALLAAYEDAL